jgi:hypothetical protein
MKQEQSTLPRIPLTAVAAMLSLPAHAALLTLACEGTIKTEVQSGAQIEYPLSQGIVIDWDNRSVKGLSGGVGQIYEMDTQVIRFRSSDGNAYHLSGSIDRITGRLFATTGAQIWDMKCRPAQRMF